MSYGFDAASRWTKFTRLGTGLLRDWMGLNRPTHFEPTSGLSSIVGALTDAAIAAGIEVRLNCPVERMHATPDHAVLSMANGSVVKASHVFFTAKAIGKTGQELADSASALLDYHQCYLLLEQASEMFSYFRVISHPVFFLAADLTRSAQPALPNGSRIVSLNLVSGLYCDQVSLQTITAFMQQNALIQRNVVIKSIEWENIKAVEIDFFAAESFNASNRYLTTIHAQNLVRTFHRLIQAPFLQDRLEQRQPSVGVLS
jgi:hypothetical protein